MAETMMQRPIPRTGESLPVIGLGTWQTFDVGSSAADREPLRQVLSEFVELGGRVVDSSPMVRSVGTGHRRSRRGLECPSKTLPRNQSVDQREGSGDAANGAVTGSVAHSAH